MDHKIIMDRYTSSEDVGTEEEPKLKKVWLNVNHQHFCVGEVEDEGHALWMRVQLSKAIANLIDELK